MSLFENSLNGEDLREDSAKGVYDLFSRRYQVKNVRPLYGDKYSVQLKDGSHKTVAVGKRCTIFGEERAFVKWVE